MGKALGGGEEQNTLKKETGHATVALPWQAAVT